MVNEGRTGVALGGNGGSRLCRWVVECQMSRCDPNCCPEGSSNGYPLAVQTLAVISRIPPPVFECDRRHIDAVGFEFPNNNISNVLERCNPPDFRHYDEHHTICFAFGNLFSVTLLDRYKFLGCVGKKRIFLVVLPPVMLKGQF